MMLDEIQITIFSPKNHNGLFTISQAFFDKFFILHPDQIEACEKTLLVLR